jgi:hypothetical protein
VVPTPFDPPSPCGDQRYAREIYTIDDPELAAAFVARLGVDLQNSECPPEIRQLGRTIVRWSAQISAWHTAGCPTGRPKRRTT